MDWTVVVLVVAFLGETFQGKVTLKDFSFFARNFLNMFARDFLLFAHVFL